MVDINMRLTRLVSEFRGNILCFIVDTLDRGTRNPTILFKCSSTEETKNHLTVKWHLIFCIQKTLKEWLLGASLFGVFLQFITCAFYWCTQREATSGIEGGSKQGRDVSKSPEKG